MAHAVRATGAGRQAGRPAGADAHDEVHEAQVHVAVLAAADALTDEWRTARNAAAYRLGELLQLPSVSERSSQPRNRGWGDLYAAILIGNH